MNSFAPRFDAAEDIVAANLPPQPHRLQVVALSNTVAAAFFDHSRAARLPQARITARTGSTTLCLPLIASELARSDGGCRSVFLLNMPAREISRDGLWIDRNQTPLAEIDPLALQSPLVDPYALLAGLSDDGNLRLLRLLLTTGMSLFGRGALTGFRDITAQVLERLSPSVLPLRAWCPVSATAAIVSYSIPRDRRAEDFTDLIGMEDTAVSRLSGAEADIEDTTEGRLLHLFLPEGLRPGSTLVALSDSPQRLAGPADGEVGRPLGAWLARRTPRIRKQARARLTRIAAQDETAAALLDEMACPEVDRPKVMPHLLAQTPGGLLYAVGLNDPHRLARALILRSDSGDIELPLGPPCFHRHLGRLQVGYYPMPQPCEPGDRAELHVLYRSGRLSLGGDCTVTAFSATLPDILRELPADRLAPALADALNDMLPTRPLPRVEHLTLAASPEAPTTTIIAELGGSIDYAYALAATLMGQRNVTLALTHPDPNAMAMLSAIGTDLHQIYGLGIDLIGLPGGLLPAERMRAALSCAQTDAAIYLSRDSLPNDPDWLPQWAARLDHFAPVLTRTPHDGALGLNTAARDDLLSTPLRTPGHTADLTLLAERLKSHPDARITDGPAVTAFAAPKPVPEAVTLAETRILTRELRA